MISATRKKLFSSTGVYLLLSIMFTRKAASRLLVGAFNTRSTSILTRRVTSRLSPCVRPRWLSTQGVARVDEDLDAAFKAEMQKIMTQINFIGALLARIGGEAFRRDTPFAFTQDSNHWLITFVCREGISNLRLIFLSNNEA